MAKDKKHVPARKLKALRMAGGNIVISQVRFRESFVDREYELLKPMELVPVSERGQQTMMTLVKFMPVSEQEQYQIGKEHVVCCVEPDEKIAELYKQMTNPSPIAQPKKALVLPGD